MIDPGGVVLAGIAGGLAALGCALLLHRVVPIGVLMHWPHALLAADQLTRDAVGVAAGFAVAVIWALVYAATWALTGLPITPLLGALFGVPHAILDERLLRVTTDLAPDERTRVGRLVVHLVYGAVLGAAYRP